LPLLAVLITFLRQQRPIALNCNRMSFARNNRLFASCQDGSQHV